MLSALVVGNLAAASTHLHFVAVGKGHGNREMDAEGWTKAMTVPEGVICPAVVNRRNWDKDTAGRHSNARDAFEVRQIGTEISVRRDHHKHKTWGVDLAFSCEKHYERVSNACINVHVGSSIVSKVSKPDTHNRAWTTKKIDIPSEYVCPAQVSKANWKSSSQGSEVFRVKQVDYSRGKVFAVRRDNGKEGSTQWDMDLKFECCIPESQCTTVTVGGSYAADVNAETGYTKGYAVPKGAVCPAVIKKGTWSHEHSMVQHTGFQNSKDEWTTKRENGMIYLHNVKGATKRWAMHVAFECCEHPTTQYTVDEKCHPSNCAEWNCNDWCACYENAVEEADQYDVACTSDDNDCLCA